MKQHLQVLLLAAMAWLLVACGNDSNERTAVVEHPTQAIFSLTLPDLQEAPQELAQWRGQPMLVNFWATWCAPCVEEMPDLNALQGEFPNVRFVGLGVDSLESLREFSERIPVDYPLLVARSEGFDLMRELGNEAGGLPFTVLINSTEQIPHRVAGQIDPEALRSQLRSLR